MKILSIDSGTKNNAIVKINIDKGNTHTKNKIEILQADLFDFCDGRKVKQCKFEEIINNLLDKLKNYDCSDVDIILIENIPSKLNMIVKSISIATYTFFAQTNKTVKLISPSRKLGKEKNKLPYKERKNESIKLCYELISLEDKQKLQQQFKRKADDITDAILMAYNWHKAQKN